MLNYELVSPPGSSPDKWLLVLHGIYGAGRNWASVARKLVRERPDWGAVLVDLRQHGSSQGFPPPHTLAAAAADLDRLAEEAGIRVAGVMGHSFGGKVALAYARDHGEELEQAWIIDSSPAAREPSGSAWGMYGILRELPDSFESRAAAVRALEERGVATPVAQWMATNLEERDGEQRWRFDLDAMEELLLDYFDKPLWDLVDSPPATVELHFVKAEGSNVIDDDDLARLESAARASGRVHLHHVPGGHWVNADSPEQLVAQLVSELR